ncbi:cupin [Halogeometricum borinquense DSM 11551]|uniref:Cupin n=1 Tax=Halogeometricum borinquense (strain ATCC 700274 / DSM 11551 / JCM 10706 / KCTC 4070 / PR3) TaxID=469382 RepID=E4NTA5_HALBP|nr:cupin domain-containing protein [Halogeometricum borinquense]ADQ68202.1 cupin domain-containing protein [Halogeometricum borinquense DSM 11551]ELY24754.1 cupin [Halogeometricum borinquense DSM 11551]
MSEEPTAEPFVKAVDEGDTYHALGGLALLKATADETDGSFNLVERRGDENRVVTPLHVHRSDDELWYVLDGEMELFIDGELLSAEPGDTAFAPQNVPHALRIAADGTRYLVLRTPGNKSLFGAVGTSVDEVTVPTDGPDDAERDRLDTFVENSDVEILGPPPFDL